MRKRLVSPVAYDWRPRAHKGPSPITGILFQTNDVRLSWTPLPPPPNEHIHCMHMEKCLPRNAGILNMKRYTWWCLALRSISGKACDVPGSTEGLFSCFFLGGVGAYLPPFVLRITENNASDGARSRRSRVSSAEDVDYKLRLGHEGLPVSEFRNILDFFVNETTGKSGKTTRSSPKMPIFLPNEQASTLPPLKRIKIEHRSFETKCR